MEQRLSVVTPGVADLERSRGFDQGLGWTPSGGSFEGVVFFQLGGIVLGLYPRAALAEDAGLPTEGGGSGGITLAYNARSREQVDAVLADAHALVLGSRGYGDRAMKKMFPIPCDAARDKHGVTCSHSRAENGELRFRLLKNDGTAYIRTEAPPGGDWQDSHWHNKVMETYIVQSEWIGYAESRDGKPKFYVYRAGESFTTPPDVIHNVYLPAWAVIHTVKHGEAKGEARFEDSRTDAFTTTVRQVSGEDLLRRDARAQTPRITSTAGGQQYAYSKAYMHFDNLIWQVPAWATAIFAIVLAGMTRLEEKSPLVDFVGLPAEKLLAWSAVMFGLMLSVLSLALCRFRWHQIGTKSYTPKAPLRSPQVFLQAIVNTQAAVLILTAFQAFGLSIACAVGIVLLAFVAITVWQERNLVRKGKEGDRPVRTAS